MKEKEKLNSNEMEMLTKKEQRAICGGEWYFDPVTGKWYWIEPASACPPLPPVGAIVIPLT